MKHRPIYDMAAVMQFICDAGPGGITLEKLRSYSTGGIEIEEGLKHLKEVGVIYRVGPGDRYAATPDHAAVPKLDSTFRLSM